ncbi:glycosyltransferase family 2 protein [Sphingobium phenoxybenzoativorans]|uniref:glycosyltransferase family 2 protein n=1 Tax=Sphingobium phenoxybenzoativorans TaxID=1592790 RepID=UPI0008723CBB|nr:glycosyltransferase family A protein [Sphingobium phenoxybenzoativorans]
MTMEASIAVVITAYNHAHFLSAAIESVLAQSVPASELLIIDDGSNDDPAAVVAKYPQARIIRQHNQGLPAARNRGMQETSSPLLLFLDADDQLESKTLEISSEMLKSCPDAAFSYGAYVLAYEGKPKVPVRFRALSGSVFSSFLLENPIGMHGTVMYRRDRLEEAGGFRHDMKACEDYELYLRLTQKYPVISTSQVLAQYWQHDENMSRNPVTMLHWSQIALELHKQEALKADLETEFNRGISNLRRAYIGIWVGDIRKNPHFRTHFRQGFQLFLQAPCIMVAEIWHRLSKRSKIVK